MASITSLAPELLQHILDFSEPPDHLNLALTCKSLYQRLEYIILHSQECYTKYHAVSDIDPATIPNLLRAILIQNDRVAAWHIRSIEIWGVRETFDNWKPYNLVLPPDTDGNLQNPLQLGESAGEGQAVYQEGYFTDHELAVFTQAIYDVLRMPEEVVDKIDLEGDGVEGVRHGAEDIKHGRTEYLAVLLMALSPRLDAIRFVISNADMNLPRMVGPLARCINSGSFPAPVRLVPKPWKEVYDNRMVRGEYFSTEEEQITEQEEYEEALRAREGEEHLSEEIKRLWPPGFLSVREIAVGVVSRAFPSSAEEVWRGRVPIDMSHIAPLLRLPGLKSLFIHGFSEHHLEEDEFNDGNELRDDNEADHRWGLPVACSTVENMVFDCCEPRRHSLYVLIKACGQLKHLTFLDGSTADSDCDGILGWCKIPKESGTLISVLWCGTDVHGYRSAMYYPGEAGGIDIVTMAIDDAMEWDLDSTDVYDKFVEELYEALGGSARVMLRFDHWEYSEEQLEQAFIAAVRRACWDECWERDLNEDERCRCRRCLRCERDAVEVHLEGGGDMWREEEDQGEEGEGKEGAATLNENGDGEGGKEGDGQIEEEEEEEEEGEKLPCGCHRSWGNHGQYPYYPMKATALYLEDLHRRHYTADSQEEGATVAPRDPTKRPLGELIRLCKLWGVEIYTRTTPAPRVHNVAMPIIASEKDVLTNPFYKHPDVERLYFKPHVGMVDDCAHCGECEECYKLHPPECWAKWKEDDAWADEERRKREDEEEKDGSDDAGDHEEEREQDDEQDDGDDKDKMDKDD